MKQSNGLICYSFKLSHISLNIPQVILSIKSILIHIYEICNIFFFNVNLI